MLMQQQLLLNLMQQQQQRDNCEIMSVTSSTTSSRGHVVVSPAQCCSPPIHLNRQTGRQADKQTLYVQRHLQCLHTCCLHVYIPAPNRLTPITIAVLCCPPPSCRSTQGQLESAEWKLKQTGERPKRKTKCCGGEQVGGGGALWEGVGLTAGSSMADACMQVGLS